MYLLWGDTDHSEGATVGGDRSEEDGVGGEGGGGAEDGDEGEQEDDDPKPAAKNVKVTRKKLANQFNYSDRGALTYKVISRVGPAVGSFNLYQFVEDMGTTPNHGG